MTLHAEHVYALPWLVLAALPWLRSGRRARSYSWLELVPADRLSAWLDFTERLLGSAAIGGCVLGLAGLATRQPPVEHVGRGAQIVMLLDRSRSMDQPFAGAPSSNSVMAEGIRTGRESKGAAARRLLGDFARQREHDLLGLVAFTTRPIRVLDLTERDAAVLAAIEAGNVGRGLAETDIGLGLLAALDYFDDQPYNGSRVILMVSDGGAHIEPAVQQRIVTLLKRERVALYWLYLRANHAPGLLQTAGPGALADDVVPERVLHQFFQTMGTPYHAYEAEDPAALQTAIRDLDRLEQSPIRYQSAPIRHDLARPCYLLALACSLLLASAAVWAPEWR